MWQQAWQNGSIYTERWKNLPTAKAAKVISTVGEENGFEAWRGLHKRFEAGRGSMTGGAMQEMTDMLRKPSPSLWE